jgi:hypothetical protein
MMDLLQDLASRLAVPGFPDWTGLLALVLLILVGLAYLLMPFAVFGVKGRLDVIEAQLDELQSEIRSLALRQGADMPRRSAAMSSEDWAEARTTPRRAASPAREEPTPRVTPPIPPPAAWPEGRGGGRAEPRLDWPGRGGRA